jgi:hypothetical protein
MAKKSYEGMTVAELEAEIHAINAQEREQREEKRAIHALINEKLPAEREAENERHQAEAAAVAEAANAGGATSANVDAPAAEAVGGNE